MALSAAAAGDAIPLEEVTPQLPFTVADYVDFYSSLEHATNLGRMFRPDSEPLLPNWRHLPVGYHGRAGTVVVSGTPIRRPRGQAKPPDADAPTYGPSRRLDIELELGFVVGVPSTHGEPVPASAFADHVFGVVLVNDWSARDIQAWEYVPLGPFLGKSFATSVSAWVTPLALLDDRRVAAPPQEPEPLPHLRVDGDWAYDLPLEVELNGTVISRGNARGALLDDAAAARARDLERRERPHRRPDGVGDDLRRRARQRGQPDRADLERQRAGPARGRQRADVPRGRRRGRPPRRAARRGARPHRRMRLFGALRHPAEPRILLLRSRPGVAAAARRRRRPLDRGGRRDRRRVRAPARDAAVAPAPAPVRRGRGRLRARALRSGLEPAGARALGRRASDLDGLRLKDDDQRSLLAGYLDALERDDVPPERPPWARPGWLGGVREWLERETARLGHTVLAIEQVKTWSISAVLRVRTDGPTLFFKVSAPLPLFVDEAAVTAELAARFPGYVPAPLAVEAERGWLLLAEFDEPLGWSEPLETRRELFSRFAGLQRRSVPVVDELLAAGCLDRRLHVLEAQLDPLFANPVAVGAPHRRGDVGAEASGAEAEGGVPPARRARACRRRSSTATSIRATRPGSTASSPTSTGRTRASRTR